MATTIKPFGTFVNYGGTDIIAMISVPGEDKPYTFAELETVSYSIHREKVAVRVLGHADPRWFTYGPRTIAGTLVFTNVDKHILYRAAGKLKEKYPRLVADQLPPFHISIAFADEYGNRSRLILWNCTIADEGGVFSIEDLVSEGTMGYFAASIDLMDVLDGEKSGTGYAQRSEGAIEQESSEPFTKRLVGLLLSGVDEPVSGVKIRVIGDGVDTYTTTKEDGTYSIKLPESADNLRIYAIKDGHTHVIVGDDTPLSGSVAVPDKRTVNLVPVDESNTEYRMEDLEKPYWDPTTFRIWLNGKEITEDRDSRLYSVDFDNGRVIFNHSLRDEDVVQVYVEMPQSIYVDGSWSDPVRASLRGVLIEGNTDLPISGATVTIQTRHNGTQSVRTDESGAFAFETMTAKPIQLYATINGRRFPLALPEELNDETDLGTFYIGLLSP